MLKVLVVAAAGGLGREVVKEAVSRGHAVSVIVRSRAKLEEALQAETIARLASVDIADATDAATVAKAAAGKDVVIGLKGGDVDFARVLAEQGKAAGAKKLIFVAGATNIAMADGSMGVEHWARLWAPARAAFASHQACIDAIKATGVTSVIFCPGMMKAAGHKSAPPPPVLTRSPMAGASWVSYEDAAHAILEAAERPDFDGQHITAYSG